MTVKLRGFKATERALKRIAQQGSLAALTITRAQARELLKRAQAVAPRLSGDLENSGKVVEVRQGPDRIAWGVAFDSEYAIIRHEDFYNLGPVSVTKSPTVDGPIGRKYLERPYVNMRDQIIAKIAAGVKKATSG